MPHYFWLKSARQRDMGRHLTSLNWPQQFATTGQTDWHLLPTSSNPLTQQIMMSQDEAENHPDHDTDVLVAPPELKRPPQYAVVILNDDYTPMEFVIEVLQDFFGMDIDRATQVMLSVHHQGRGIAGIYPRDIAETKANQVNQYARAQGHPLLCQIEPQP